MNLKLTHRCFHSLNPRKVQLSIPRDRDAAASAIREARQMNRALQIHGYDRDLQTAAVFVLQEAEIEDAPRSGQLHHVARQLASAAID